MTQVPSPPCDKCGGYHSTLIECDIPPRILLLAQRGEDWINQRLAEAAAMDTEDMLATTDHPHPLNEYRIPPGLQRPR